jgi:tRNA A37 threonylcarbamoyladenosine modification protein TsaB
MAAAKGLATALDLPIVGLSSYRLLAEALYNKFGETIVLIPSRRDEFYFGEIFSDSFDDDTLTVINAAQIPAKSAGRPVYIHDHGGILDYDKPINIIEPESYRYSIRELAAAGQKKLGEVGADDITALEPLYVHKFLPGNKR